MKVVCVTIILFFAFSRISSVSLPSIYMTKTTFLWNFKIYWTLSFRAYLSILMDTFQWLVVFFLKKIFPELVNSVFKHILIFITELESSEYDLLNLITETGSFSKNSCVKRLNRLWRQLQSFIHCAVCFKTIPKPLPRPVRQRVRSNFFSLKFQYLLLSLTQYSSC